MSQRTELIKSTIIRHDEILNMKAGKEMDEAIANIFEKKPAVMNVNKLRELAIDDWRYSCAYLDSAGGIWEVEIGLDAPEFPEWRPKYFYSRDIAAAWQVVEYFIDGVTPNDCELRTTVRGWRCDLYRGSANSETAPEAICKAALIAAKSGSNTVLHRTSG